MFWRLLFVFLLFFWLFNGFIFFDLSLNCLRSNYHIFRITMHPFESRGSLHWKLRFWQRIEVHPPVLSFNIIKSNQQPYDFNTCTYASPNKNAIQNQYLAEVFNKYELLKPNYLNRTFQRILFKFIWYIASLLSLATYVNQCQSAVWFKSNSYKTFKKSFLYMYFII